MITIASPAKPTTRRAHRPRHDWSPLAAALANVASGTWLSIPLNELPGDTTADKQRSIIVVFSTKVLPTERFQTQTEGDTLFFRVTTKTK